VQFEAQLFDVVIGAVELPEPLEALQFVGQFLDVVGLDVDAGQVLEVAHAFAVEQAGGDFAELVVLEVDAGDFWPDGEVGAGSVLALDLPDLVEGDVDFPEALDEDDAVGESADGVVAEVEVLQVVQSRQVVVLHLLQLVVAEVDVRDALAEEEVGEAQDVVVAQLDPAQAGHPRVQVLRPLVRYYLVAAQVDHLQTTQVPHLLPDAGDPVQRHLQALQRLYLRDRCRDLREPASAQVQSFQLADSRQAVGQGGQLPVAFEVELHEFAHFIDAVVDPRYLVAGQVEGLQAFELSEALGDCLQPIGGEIHFPHAQLSELRRYCLQFVVLEVDGAKVEERADGGGQLADSIVLAPQDDQLPAVADAEGQLG
jgi:hypothetical protein